MCARYHPRPARSPLARRPPQLTKTFLVGGDETSRVCALGLSPNEEDLAVVCASGQAYAFKLANYELFKPGDVTLRPLVTPFHSVPSLVLANEEHTAT